MSIRDLLKNEYEAYQLAEEALAFVELAKARLKAVEDRGSNYHEAHAYQYLTTVEDMLAEGLEHRDNNSLITAGDLDNDY